MSSQILPFCVLPTWKMGLYYILSFLDIVYVCLGLLLCLASHFFEAKILQFDIILPIIVACTLQVVDCE